AGTSLGRGLFGPVTSRQILLQVRERLVHCFHNHPQCHAQGRSNVRPTRFLDVNPSTSPENVKLTHLDTDNRRPYVTLSYVWGRDQQTKTTMATKARHESAILITTLPRTIQDAILFTRLMGADLLWVDSLCIVQDDPDEVAREIAKMASYYGNSLFTLSVAAAQDCDEGFLNSPLGQVPRATGWVQFGIPFFNSLSNYRGRLTLFLSRDQNHRPEDSDEPIERRAWTLQETLLSRRLVVIEAQSTSWSCLTVNHGSILNVRTQLLDLRKEILSLPRVSVENRHGTELQQTRDLLASPFEIKDAYSPWQDEEMIESSLCCWFQIVEQYMSRVLSDRGDVLNAISGVAQALSNGVSDNPLSPDAPKYLAGLWWSKYLPLELLWDAKPQDATEFRSNAPYIAPSWSWASAPMPATFTNPLAFPLSTRAFQHFEVISCFIQRQTPKAPYGAVISGHLLVKGRVIHGLLQNLEISEYNFTFMMDPWRGESDNATLRKDEKDVTLLEILTEEAFDGVGGHRAFFYRGLVLMMQEEGSFSRIGTFGNYIVNTGNDRERRWLEFRARLIGCHGKLKF
ncbi:heterokaryon incompatibility protein-domain-containing protein, partial [Rhypophila decipiens]